MLLYSRWKSYFLQYPKCNLICQWSWINEYANEPMISSSNFQGMLYSCGLVTFPSNEKILSSNKFGDFSQLCQTPFSLPSNRKITFHLICEYHFCLFSSLALPRFIKVMPELCRISCCNYKEEDVLQIYQTQNLGYEPWTFKNIKNGMPLSYLTYAN